MIVSQRGPVRSEHIVPHAIFRSEHIAPNAALDPVALNELLTRELRPEDYDLLLLLDEGIAKRPGLVADTFSVEALPEHLVQGEDVGGKCMVCLDTYLAGDSVKQLQCSHVFHA